MADDVGRQSLSWISLLEINFVFFLFRESEGDKEFQIKKNEDILKSMGKHEISTLCVTKPQDYRHSPTIQIIQKTKQNDSYYEGEGGHFSFNNSATTYEERREYLMI